ncbi:MAG: serine/threonine protein kinase [Candidatus Riflebacteria bacterium]|nr:serine/threonine protein kinase [Candidatus Riflebacteria bacterium]
MKDAKVRAFGRYQVKSELGRGGMAVVYRAFDPELGRDVAVKVLGHGHSLTSDEAVERFRREVKAMAVLSHPNILRIFDGGVEQEQPFLVTELIQGVTVECLIEAGELRSVSRAFRSTADLLDGLAVVHQAGLVHRDIKPSNLMMTAERRLVLMDFGIALAAFGDKLTRTGEVPGSLGYLPPECLSGRKATPASDLFQVALVLYEMLSGEPLFSVSSPQDFLLMHLELPLRGLFAKRPGLPSGLLPWLERALAPAPEDRFINAGEMRAALLAIDPAGRAAGLDNGAGPARPEAARATGPWSSRRAFVAMTLGLTLATSGVTAYWLSHPAASPSRFQVVVREDALTVTWWSLRSYRGAVRVEVPDTLPLVAEEVAPSRAHELRLPGSFKGLKLTVSVASAGGEWGPAVTLTEP